MHKLLIILLLTLNGIAQSYNTDSLKQVLKNAKSDTAKCNVIAKLIESTSDDEFLKYNNQLNDITQKAITNKTEPKIRYLKYHAGVLNNYGFYHYNKGEIIKALEFMNQSLDILEQIGDKFGLATTLNNIGAIYSQQGDISSGLDFLHKSLKLREEINDKNGISETLGNLATIYYKQGEVKKAIESWEKCIKLQLEIGDQYGHAVTLNNIGYAYQKQNKLNIALEYYQKGFEIEKSTGNIRGMANILSNIADIYAKQGNETKASESYNYCLKLNEEVGDKKGIANTLNHMANQLYRFGKLSESNVLANKGMSLAKELGFPEGIMNFAHTLKLIYSKQNKFKDAMAMFELEIKMKDSISNQETRKATIKKQMQYQFETEKAVADIEHKKELEKQKELAEEKNRKQNIITASVSLGLIFVLIFAIIIFRSFKEKQKANEIITLQKQEVENQKHLIEEKHREITDSINYAERIQKSFLATTEHLNSYLSDYFILFKPKDIVSGDFYWSSTLSNGNFILVTADSTGHGVPGAIMSLLNITSLEKAIETETEPSAIINTTRKIIIDRLKKDGSEEGGKDGMDCSVCVYDLKNKKLLVAAAHNPIWIIRGKELIEIKADKMPVGKHDKQNIPFTQHEIQLQTNDLVYTLTDGYADQFGGDTGKKFMSKNLKELILSNSHLSLTVQKQILDSTFINWAKNLEQIDDVTIIGVRI